MVIVTVGIDLARNVFAVHGVDETGKPAQVLPDTQIAKKGQVLRCHTESNPAAARTSSGISLQDLAPEAEDVAMQDLTLLARDPAGAFGPRCRAKPLTRDGLTTLSCHVT